VLRCIAHVIVAGTLALVPGVHLAAEEAAAVRASALASIALYPEHAASATVVSNGDVVISAEIAAHVETFDARVGDILEKDAAVASLDCRDFDNEVLSADAALEVVDARLMLAERRLKRARTTSARFIGSRESRRTRS